MQTRKFKSGAYATIISAMMIIVVIIVNLMFTKLNFTFDMTLEGKYSLTEETVEMLGELEDDITFYYLASSADSIDLFDKILAQYTKYGENITLVYKDPLLNPKFASQYTSVTPQEYSIIVVNGPGSFTGERIAVTIGKTISYCLNIPIRVIDALTINAININSEVKITALEDRTGAYVGKFDANNKPLEQFQYMNKTLYNEFKDNNDVVVDVNIDYEKVYEYIMTLESLNPHEVKPLYIKGISALDDK